MIARQKGAAEFDGKKGNTCLEEKKESKGSIKKTRNIVHEVFRWKRKNLGAGD